MKTEQLTESADNSDAGTLSNYHIKTLMLWACELKPNSWWTDDFNIVRICVDLLHTLAGCLTEARCPHYFVSKCNLVDESFPLQTLASRLLSADRDWLSQWFVNNYLRRSVHFCPESVSRLFDDVSTSIKLADAVSAAVDWRLKTRYVDRWLEFNSTENYIADTVSCYSKFDPSTVCVFTKQLAKIDPRLAVYSTALTFLQIANRIVVGLRGGTMETLKAWLANNGLQALLITARDYFTLSRCFNEHNFSLRHKVLMAFRNDPVTSIKLADLVELLRQSSVGLLTTFLQIEARDFGSVATIATTMFEAIYSYKLGDYQRCLQLSTRNVHMLINADYMTYVPTFPEFIQLLDDEIVSLKALTLIVDAKCREGGSYDIIVTQLTLSLYLMTQCQLRFRHSVTSLAQTFDYIEVAQRRQDNNWTLNHLTLKLIERKLMTLL